MKLKCPICSCSLHSNICSTPCGHIYHEMCLQTWLNIHKSCPQCRKGCTKKSVINLFLSPNIEEDDVPPAPALPVTDIQIVGTKIDDLSSGVNNKIDQISMMIENFGMTFSSWGTKNQQLTEENYELKGQFAGMQAEIADLTQKLAIDHCNSREFEKSVQRLEKENQELKTKIQSLLGVVTVISDSEDSDEPLSNVSIRAKSSRKRKLESPEAETKKKGRKSVKK